MMIENYINYLILDAYSIYILSKNENNEYNNEFANENEYDLNLENIKRIALSDSIEYTNVFKENIGLLKSENFIDNLYYYIDEYSYDFNLPIDSIISYLIINFICKNYNNKNIQNVIDYLKNNEPEKIIDKFFDDENFGMLILKSYIYNYDRIIKLNNKDKEEVKEIINKWNNKFLIVSSLNQNIKRYILLAYYSIEDELDSSLDAINSLRICLEEKNCKRDNKYIRYINSNREYVLKLIYSYLYSEICYHKELNIKNEINYKALIYIKNVVENNYSLVPDDSEVFNKIIEYFICLSEEYDKVNIYIDNSFDSKEVIKKIKKFNKGIIIDSFDVY